MSGLERFHCSIIYIHVYVFFVCVQVENGWFACVQRLREEIEPALPTMPPQATPTQPETPPTQPETPPTQPETPPTKSEEGATTQPSAEPSPLVRESESAGVSGEEGEVVSGATGGGGELSQQENREEKLERFVCKIHTFCDLEGVCVVCVVGLSRRFVREGKRERKLILRCVSCSHTGTILPLSLSLSLTHSLPPSLPLSAEAEGGGDEEEGGREGNGRGKEGPG